MSTNNNANDGKAIEQSGSNQSRSTSNAIKDPSDWTTGNEPMTEAQQSFLETLLGRKINEPLTKGEAAIMIDENKNKSTGGGSAPASGSAIKDPENWSTGDEEMTGAQKSYLKTLSQQAGSDTVDETLTKAEASMKIEELQQQTGRGTQNNGA